VVHSPKATNNDIGFLFAQRFRSESGGDAATAALMVKDGLRLFSPAAALVRVPESFFMQYPVETQVVMATLLTPRTYFGSPERRSFLESRLFLPRAFRKPDAPTSRTKFFAR